MSSALKIKGPIIVGRLASDPAGEEGQIYYNTTSGTYKYYENGGWREVSAELIEAHLNGAASKHDATEIDYERLDGSKKNIQASSDDVETALTDLDDSIGSLEASPTNYTPSNAAIVASHFAAIDSALANAGQTSFLDSEFEILDNLDNTKKVIFEVSSVGTGTSKTINMPNANVNLGDIASNNSLITTHLNGAANKHDASEIDVEAADGLNHSQADLETVIGELDDAIGNLGFAVSNYTDPAANVVADHLANIDTAIGTKANDADVIKKDGSVAYTADQPMGSNKITGLADPTNPQDAATKAYVDSISAGLDPKESVRAATTANIDLTTGGTLTIDGVNTSAGDRILVRAQTDPTENGIYEVAAGAWSRASDMDGTPSSEVSGGNFTFVEQGSTYQNTGWVLQGDGELALGVDNLNWTQFSGAGQITAGDGLTKTGETIDVNPGDGVQIVSDAVAVDGTVIRNDGSVAFGAAQSFGGFKATNVADGTVASDAVNKSQLDTKIGNVVEDTTPELGGNLDTAGNAILHDTNGVKRGNTATPTNLVEEEYIDSITLSASQTGTTISDLTFAHASFEGMEIVYKLKESTSNDVRIGTIRVVTNGTNVAINDVSTETSDVGITFSAAINGSNVEISYDSGSNSVNMRCDVKRIRA